MQNIIYIMCKQNKNNKGDMKMQIMVFNKSERKINYVETEQVKVEVNFSSIMEEVYQKYYSPEFQNSKEPELFIGGWEYGEAGIIIDCYEKNFEDSTAMRRRVGYVEFKVSIAGMKEKILLPYLTDDINTALEDIGDEIKRGTLNVGGNLNII